MDYHRALQHPAVRNNSHLPEFSLSLARSISKPDQNYILPTLPTRYHASCQRALKRDSSSLSIQKKTDKSKTPVKNTTDMQNTLKPSLGNLSILARKRRLSELPSHKIEPKDNNPEEPYSYGVPTWKQNSLQHIKKYSHALSRSSHRCTLGIPTREPYLIELHYRLRKLREEKDIQENLAHESILFRSLLIKASGGHPGATMII